MSLRNRQEKIRLNNQENCEVLAVCFENLLNCPPPTFRLEIPDLYDNSDEDEPPTTKEIWLAIKNLKIINLVEKTQ